MPRSASERSRTELSVQVVADAIVAELLGGLLLDRHAAVLHGRDLLAARWAAGQPYIGAADAHRARPLRVFRARVRVHVGEGPMARDHHRTSITIALVAALIVVAALAAACSAQATGGAPPRAGPDGGASTGARRLGHRERVRRQGAWPSDWSRVLARSPDAARPPAKPVVVLLGGSAARESTISDASWRNQIVTKGGPATLAWNMGSPTAPWRRTSPS